MSHPAETLQTIYAAFSRGDIPAILALCAEDIAWEIWPDNQGQRAGVPWLQPRHGRAGAAAFFQTIAPFQFHRFEVQQILSSADEAIGRVAIDLTLPSGTRVQDEEIHWFRFNAAGQIVAFRHYLDTAKHIAAAP